MRLSRLHSLLLCLWMAGLTACASVAKDLRLPFPAGPALEQPIVFELALFYPEPPREEPRAALDALLARDFPGFTRLDEVPEDAIGNRRVIGTIWVTDARESYAAPDLEGLSYFGRGLDDAQAEALQRTDNVLRLLFAYEKEHLWSGMRDVLRLTSALARRTGGLIWDEETREMFTPDFWDEHRIASWTETADPPDLRHHFTIHAYREESGLHREITLGLTKFGLPDIAVENISGSSTDSMMSTINLLAQALAEGAAVQGNGELALDIRRLRNDAFRNERLESLSANATGKARLRLVQGTWEEGDPQNRLIEILFDRYPGPDLQARQNRLIGELWGTTEDIAASVEHDEEVLAVSEQAREKLFALKPAFLAGLPPGEVLFVKAPFQTPDGGREWMWVEVIEWKGDRISGTLQNDPVYIKDLQSGQRVEVSAAEVFDYIHEFADGTSEGNETAKYLHAKG